MLFTTSLITALAAFGPLAQAHMSLEYPPPFRAANNPHSDQNKIDYSLTAPLSGAAAFPCKGYHVDMGTPAGASVATFTPGGPYNMSVQGGAVHGGGSCQVSLSYDSGKTFNVIHSYIGSCPLSSGQKFDFTIPSDAPNGPAIFAWTWFNKVGNREMYMDCASVTIGGASKRDVTAFASRPKAFVANVANGCSTVEGQDVIFPNPGGDITGSTTGDNKGFTGTCGSSGGGSGASAPVASGAPAAPKAPSTTSATSTLASVVIVPTQPSSASTLATSTASAPSTGTTGKPSAGGLIPSVDGECSGPQTCAGSAFGNCCSKFGFCGATSVHCGAGCMAAFGNCGTSSNATVSRASLPRDFARGIAGRIRT